MKKIGCSVAYWNKSVAWMLGWVAWPYYMSSTWVISYSMVSKCWQAVVNGCKTGALKIKD